MSSEDAAPAPAEAWLAEAPSDAILPEVAPAEEPAPAAEKPFAAVEAEAPAPEAAQPAAPAEPAEPKKVPAAATPAPGLSGDVGRARRERKAAQPVYRVEAKKEQEFVIGEGKGTKLRDILNVAFKLSKITGRDELLESLHSVLFRRKGTATQRKKAILDFSGWAFEEEAHDAEVKARSSSLSKWKLELIHRLLEVLDLPRGSGDKTSKVERLMEFLAAPAKQSDVDLASKEAAKKDKERAKKERAAARKDKDRAKKDKERAKKEKEASKRKAGDKKAPAKKKARREEEGEEEEEESDAESEPASASESEPSEAEPMEEEEAPVAAAEAKEEAEAAPPAEAPAAGEDDPALAIPADTLADDVRAHVSGLSAEELAAMSAKSVMAALQAQYGFPVRARKKEIKEIAQRAAEELPPPEAA